MGAARWTPMNSVKACGELRWDAYSECETFESLPTRVHSEGVLRASTSEKPLELTRLVKQCSDILKLCHWA